MRTYTIFLSKENGVMRLSAYDPFDPENNTVILTESDIKDLIEQLKAFVSKPEDQSVTIELETPAW